MTLVEPARASARDEGRDAGVEEQLRRVAARLLAEADGDPVQQDLVRGHLARATARFAAAPIRQFLPILIERDVRRQLAAG